MRLRTLHYVTLSMAFLFLLNDQHAQAGMVTWADFSATLPPIGVTTTVSLGGGSQADILFTADSALFTYGGGTFGTAGVPETGLNYTDLNHTVAFGNSGSGTVNYGLTINNIVTGANHTRGLLFFGNVSNIGGPLNFAATGGGSVSSWTQVGSQFVVGDTGSWTWTPGTGTLTSNSNNPDAGGIILDLGSLSDYTQIDMSFAANIEDGWRYGFGEEVPAMGAVVPEPSTYALIITGLIGLGLVRRKRKVAC